MEFWGVEVPSGKSLTCDPGEESYVHVSQAALGESKSGKGNDRVVLKVKVGNVEVVVGTLAQGRCDQTPLDLIFDKQFVLSHSSTSGSVYFCGYKTDAVKDDDMLDDEEYDSDSEGDVPHPGLFPAKENGKPGSKPGKSETLATKPVVKAPVQKVDAPAVATKSQASKTKPQSKEDKVDDEAEDDDDDDELEEDEEDEDDDEDEDDELLDDASDEDDDLLESDDEDELDEDDSEEEQPKSAGKKRPSDMAKNAGSEKKAKIATPTGAGKPGGKIDAKTPTPALTPKQQQRNEKKDSSAKKTPGKENSSKGGTPTSGKKLGQFFCQPCSKPFQSESALEQHNSAKHK